MLRLLLLIILPAGMAAASATARAADEPTSVAVVADRGYSQAIEIRRGPIRVVLCPERGGRVLEFSVGGNNAMYFDEAEKSPQPGKPLPATAGRFDFGPELTVAPHPRLWSGPWSADITSADRPSDGAKLTSPADDPSGFRLTREFRLGPGPVPHLICKQTILNGSTETREVCHWGRSFSPGGGVCLVPLGDRPSRFPAGYAMYEDSAIINVRNTDEQIRHRDGFLEILAPPRKPKLGFDSYAGWLGYLMPGDKLFVKRFRTYPDRVYNEAAGLTLSVWYPEGPRIELEPIGPRERLAPGQSASFTEEWWLLDHAFPKPDEQIDLQKLAAEVAKQTKPPSE
jgi:hypothetical protein